MAFICPSGDEKKKLATLEAIAGIVKELQQEYATNECCKCPNEGRPEQDIGADPPAAMICYRIPKVKSGGAANKNSKNANNEPQVNRLKESKSRELRASIMYIGCDCEKRNGLQDDCQRTECHGSPECLTKPNPTCGPSQFCNGKHLGRPYPPIGKNPTLGNSHGITSQNTKNNNHGLDYEYMCYPIEGLDFPCSCEGNPFLCENQYWTTYGPCKRYIFCAKDSGTVWTLKPGSTQYHPENPSETKSVTETTSTEPFPPQSETPQPDCCEESNDCELSELEENATESNHILDPPYRPTPKPTSPSESETTSDCCDENMSSKESNDSALSELEENATESNHIPAPPYRPTPKPVTDQTTNHQSKEENFPPESDITTKPVVSREEETLQPLEPFPSPSETTLSEESSGFETSKFEENATQTNPTPEAVPIKPPISYPGNGKPPSPFQPPICYPENGKPQSPFEPPISYPASQCYSAANCCPISSCKLPARRKPLRYCNPDCKSKLIFRPNTVQRPSYSCKPQIPYPPCIKPKVCCTPDRRTTISACTTAIENSELPPLPDVGLRTVCWCNICNIPACLCRHKW